MSESDPPSGEAGDRNPGAGPGDAEDDRPPVEFEYDEAPPDAESPAGTAAFFDALNVRRNAAAGLLIGVVVAGLTFVVFALQPQTSRPAVGYLALAFVLAVSLGGLLAFVFTLGSAVRLARSE